MDGPDMKLDFEQRARSVALEPQVVDDPEWACDAIIWQRDRIATLESQLAASEAKCADLVRQADELVVQRNQEIMLRIDAESSLATERAARAEAERVAVWAAKHDAKHRVNVRRFIDEDNGSRLIWHQEPSWTAQFVEIPKNSTDADLYRALVEACEGGRDGE